MGFQKAKEQLEIDAEGKGNSGGNFNNDDYTVEQGNCIYYKNYKDGEKI